MRSYAVTTNTDLVLAAPVLTVTVRTALFIPREVLPPWDVNPKTQADAATVSGRETWSDHVGVPAFFKLSQRLTPGKPAALEDVKGQDGKVIQAKLRERKTGVVFSEVKWSRAPDSDGSTIFWAARWDNVGKRVGEAVIPLWGLEPGEYLLAVIPPDDMKTKPDAPSGPDTEVPAGAQKRTYRPLYIKLTLDLELRLVEAKTVLLSSDNRVYENPPVTVMEMKGVVPTPKVVGRLISHGYVTAFSSEELAIDWKPDVVTVDNPALLHERSRAIDMVVVHHTGGAILGPALNTMVSTSSIGPHYEIDLDGHNVKFCSDKMHTNHPYYNNYWFAHEGRTVQGSVGARSIGIELINYEGKEGHLGFPEQQMVALIKLLKALKERYKVRPYYFVGHSDVIADKDHDWRMDSERRLTCPGRLLDWPRLEKEGLGRVTATTALSDPNRISSADNLDGEGGKAPYSGFFTLTPDDFPKGFPGRPSGKFLFLRSADNDAGQRWGGINWGTKEAQAFLKEKGLDFKGIVKELQKDVQTLGYSIDVNGSFDDKCQRAVTHMIYHTFSGTRRGLAEGGNGNNPKPWITPTVAQHIKVSVAAIEKDVQKEKAEKAAKAPSAPPPAAPGGAPPPAAKPASTPPPSKPK